MNVFKFDSLIITRFDDEGLPSPINDDDIASLQANLDNSILVALDEFKMEYVGSMSSQAQMNGWVTNYNAGEWGGYAVRSTPER